MQQAKQAAVEFTLRWQSDDASHGERLYFEKINFWRDFFPGTLGDQLAALPAGGVASQSFAPGELLPAYSPAAVHAVHAEQVHLKTRSGQIIKPRAGRFYPRGMFSRLPDVYAGDLRPLRYLSTTEGGARVDLNHPLARFPLHIEGRVIETLGGGKAAPAFVPGGTASRSALLPSRDGVMPREGRSPERPPSMAVVSGERGGRSHDPGAVIGAMDFVSDELTRNGPGMQARHPDAPTDFFSDEPFARIDEREDRLLYIQPNLTHHLDAMVRSQVASLYARFLKPGMRVLDLMSGWASHLPEPLDLDVTGLGLNAEELEHNSRLNVRMVHDHNREPALPFADASFDAVLCTAAVEYLVRPVEVFRDVRRVLKSGAPFVVTFSERWVPAKAIRIWSQLHPFERLGLVLDYFRASGFTALGTETARDWPRPPDDPLYAVWGLAP